MVCEAWEDLYFQDVVNYIKSGISENQNKEGKGFPVTRIETISDGTVNYEKVGYLETDKNIDNHLLDAGDILFSNINSIKHIGKIALYNGEQTLYHGMNLLRIKLERKKIDIKFGYYLLCSQPSVDYFQANAKQAINQASLNQKDILGMPIKLPPLYEQRKIAAILTSVDNAIVKTDAIIKQTEKVKAALMQQLLMKGIGHTEFKQTEIGKIPVEWDVLSIAECCEILDNMRVPLSKKVRETIKGNIPYYGATGIVDYINKYLYDFEVVLIGEDGDHFNKYRDWSMTSLVNGKSWVNNHAHVMRAKEMLTNEWLHRFLEHRDITRYLAIQGATRLKLTQQSLRKIPIAIPPLNEQESITKVIHSVENKINIEKEKLTRYQVIKRGLMQSLLTGNIRVNIDEKTEVII